MKLKDRPPPQQLAGILLGALFCSMVLLAVVGAWKPQSGVNHFFSNVCHQQTERSHTMDGHAFGVCVRCFWLYAGLAVGCLRFGYSVSRSRGSKTFLISSLMLAGTSWICGWVSPSMDWVLLRVTSSLLLGLAVSQYMVPGVAELLSSTSPITSTMTINHESKRA